MSAPLRVVVADDERPARSYLLALLRSCRDVHVVGEVASGREAVAVIESTRPDLALLDWQMPELDGLGVVRMLKKDRLPLIAFVTAFDEYAVRAFEVNAVDYLLKPVDAARLRETLNRAYQRLEHAEALDEQASHVATALDSYEDSRPREYLERIPVRQRDAVVLVAVHSVATIVADGELLQITTIRHERYTIAYRLKDLEQRLNPAHFVKLGRGTLANVDEIKKIHVMPGGSHVAVMGNGQELPISRLQSRALRERLLKL